MKKELSKKINKVVKKGKSVLKNFFSSIKKTILSLWDKFMDLPQRIRLILIVWGVVVALILLFITIANSTNKFYDKYARIESVVTESALGYVQDNRLYGTKDKKIILDIQILREEGYLTKKELEDETCGGISVIYYDDDRDEYVIDSYLNCKRYTSKNYWDYK